MSKLADKIRKATSLSAQQLGFGSAKASRTATMLLAGIARDAAAAAELVRAGADVVIVGSSKSPAKPERAKVEDAIAGAYVGGSTDNESTSFRESGFDFVVFEPSASAITLLDEDIGYVMVLPSDLSDSEVRTLESFQLDALDIGGIEGSLSVRRQIDLRRIFAMTRKPLMASVDAGISSLELQALRDTNVVVVTAEGASAVERLRKTIDGLPPRARRKDSDRPTPLVPRAAVVEEADDAEE